MAKKTSPTSEPAPAETKPDAPETSTATAVAEPEPILGSGQFVPTLIAPMPDDNGHAAHDDLPIETQSEPQVEDEDPPPEDVIDESDIKEAASYGLSKEDAESFGTKKALERALMVFDRQVARGFKNPTTGNPPPVQPAAPPAQPQQQPPPPPAPSAMQGDYMAYQPKIDAQEYPEMHAEISALAKHVQDQVMRQVQAVLPRLDAPVGTANQALNLALIGQLDAILAKTGESYKGHIGEGSLFELDPNSDAYKARLDIYQTALAWDARARQMGQPISIKQAVQRSLRGVLGDKIETIARQQAAKELEERKKTAVPRPSKPGGTGQRPSTQQQHISNLANRMKELGLGQAATVNDHQRQLHAYTRQGKNGRR